MDRPFATLYGRKTCDPSKEKNIYSHQIKAKSAGQRERRADVTTRKNLKQGRFVSEI